MPLSSVSVGTSKLFASEGQDLHSSETTLPFIFESNVVISSVEIDSKIISVWNIFAHHIEIESHLSLLVQMIIPPTAAF
jgi:hypothetical protein